MIITHMLDMALTPIMAYSGFLILACLLYDKWATKQRKIEEEKLNKLRKEKQAMLIQQMQEYYSHSENLTLVTGDEEDEEEDMHDCLVSKAISKIEVPDTLRIKLSR